MSGAEMAIPRCSSANSHSGNSILGFSFSRYRLPSNRHFQEHPHIPRDRVLQTERLPHFRHRDCRQMAHQEKYRTVVCGPSLILPVHSLLAVIFRLIIPLPHLSTPSPTTPGIPFAQSLLPKVRLSTHAMSQALVNISRFELLLCQRSPQRSTDLRPADLGSRLIFFLPTLASLLRHYHHWVT